MATASRSGLTVEEYLRLEREAGTKSEYLAGEVFAMAGATREHNLVVMNVGGELRNRLRQTACEVYPSDMRVAAPSGLYTYPDVSLSCEPTFLDQRKDTLLNPVLVVEVLSESTEAYDRGRKFEHYRSVASLREYLLVSTSVARVERFRRTEDGWLFDEAVGLQAVLHVACVGAALPLSEVYARVELPAETGLQTEEAQRERFFALAVPIPLTATEHQTLKKLASTRGLDESTLIHEWVKEKLHQP